MRNLKNSEATRASPLRIDDTVVGERGGNRADQRQGLLEMVEKGKAR